ncbi:MAG: HisA/HisF-related TIM barrel protein [Candidatus Bathyarchaeia archaeon]
MKVIPVIDILNGVAVHAVRGERERYRPLKSVLCKLTDPICVARAFKEAGFTKLYIADLDAILRGTSNLDVLKQINSRIKLDMMIDAGINTIEKARLFLNLGISNIVIGTETLPNLYFIEEVLRELDAEKVVISIDIMGSEILSISEEIRRYKPRELAEKLEEIGITKLIILDLKRVGSETGVHLTLLREIVESTTSEVFAGGGIRDIKDLEDLEKIGVSGALVATALHKGTITSDILRVKGYL